MFDFFEQSQFFITFKFKITTDLLFVYQLIILIDFQHGLQQLYHQNDRLVFLMQNFKQEFDEELDVVEAFAPVEYFEFVISVLLPQVIELAHQRQTVQRQVYHVASVCEEAFSAVAWDIVYAVEQACSLVD